MTWMFLRRSIPYRELASYHFQPRKHILSLRNLRAIHNETKSPRDSLLRSKKESTSSCYDRSLHHSPLFSKISDQPNDYKIDIVDDETWQVSTGFANIMKDTDNTSHAQVLDHPPPNKNNPDFDEIDDLRICGNLFYKLDRDSKEYEEYNFDFHRRKSSKKKIDCKESHTKETQNPNSRLENVRKRKDEKIHHLSKFNEMEKNQEASFDRKKQRVPTFNQLTAAYHEPFCLDIYISKASVRVCIIHRASSKVVAVAHSISKDMKFDLSSTKDAAACAAVGKVLAQRALADDIHNVVYTPRKGEKLEGKLQIVLDSVMKNGVCVKVKIKKKNIRKTGLQFADYKHS